MNKENTRFENKQNGTDAIRDPSTSPPGAHPVGAGVGAASQGAAGTAIYVDPDSTYATYQPAYRSGYEGPSRYPGKKYEHVQADLQREYETSNAGLAWSKAKAAPRDPRKRVETTLPVGSDLD